MTPKLITFHCSATKNGEPLPAATIDKWHREERGWKKIGYHVVCQPNGEIEHAGNSVCRGLNEQGAHVEGANKDNIGVCLIGYDRFTYDQLWAMRDHVLSIMGVYDIPPWNLRVHSGFPGVKKTCPNMRIENLIMWIVWGDIRAIENYVGRK